MGVKVERLTVTPQKEGWQAVTMKTIIEDSKRCNTVAMREVEASQLEWSL